MTAGNFQGSQRQLNRLHRLLWSSNQQNHLVAFQIQYSLVNVTLSTSSLSVKISTLLQHEAMRRVVYECGYRVVTTEPVETAVTVCAEDETNSPIIWLLPV